MDADLDTRERSSTDSDERQYQTVTRDEFVNRLDNLHQENELYDVSPTTSQRLGPFSVFCLIMNRTIAAGIFANPDTVVSSAGSPGLAVVLWVVAGLTVYAIMVCWLELGMSVPFYDVRNGNTWTRQSAPRSGGDKNYLEYIFKKPRLLATCVFGITFLAFSNTAGNAIQFGIYIESARHPPGDLPDSGYRARVLGWAVGLMSTCCLINISTRRYAIGLNNAFAVIKIIFLLFIVFAGFGYSKTKGNSCQNVDLAVRGPARGFGDIMFALVNALYPYGGFEQPFYVLAEVRQPKKTFPKATNWAMLFLLLCYPLVNVSYFCIVPYPHSGAPLPDNIALDFFQRISPASFAVGSQKMTSTILALFIFGNVLAQTFTASRVKQEVAKEGILPWSLVFASGSDTLLSRLFPTRTSTLDDHREQAPMAATFLHWAVAVLLIAAVGAALPNPRDAYKFLVYLKAFTILGVLGLLTVGGLLYLKVDAWVSPNGGRGWSRKKQWWPWLDPVPCVLATGVLAVLLVGLCVKPTREAEKPEAEKGLVYWVYPLAGWLAPLLGVLWWVGLQFIEWRGMWKLEVTRTPLIEVEKDEFVQVAEIIERRRVYTARTRLFGIC
ncbi:amino acid transporter [Podospora conica]|nr:amino acid transporter [Schizothecium conicum]